MTDTVSDTLLGRRKALGLSRERVAAQLDPPVSSKTVERWEKGTSPVPGWRRVQLDALFAGYEGVAA
jgi:DNA-binding transcriptional regulator YiaG